MIVNLSWKEKDNDVDITMAYLPDWEKFLTVEFWNLKWVKIVKNETGESDEGGAFSSETRCHN